MLAVLAYVEANPLRAGMVADPADYRWSRYPARVGSASAPLLNDFPEWSELANDEASRRATWRSHVALRPERSALESVRASVISGRPIGGPEWCAATASRLGLGEWPPRSRGRPKKPEKLH